MDELLFSVVTVTLNCANDAVHTAQSVLTQDFAGYEYIVKDGGSTDGTVERLRGIGLTVHMENDLSIYDAMNQAIDICKGDYIYFLNAGDTFYDPLTLKNLAILIDSKYDIYYGDILLLPLKKIRCYPNNLSRYYLFRKNLCHQALIVKREVYKELNGFNISYRYAADQEFVWRALFRYNKTIKHLDLIIANFLYGGFSTKKANRKDSVRERRHLVSQFYSPLESIFYGIVGLYFLNPLKAWIWYKVYQKQSVYSYHV